MMKKIVFFFFSMALVTGFSHCKHEPISPNPRTGDPGGPIGGGPGTGGGNITCSPDTAYFQQQVLPIFISNCAVSGCHDAITREEGIDLSHYNGIKAAGLNDIWEMINEDPDDRMPPLPRNALTSEQKNMINKWIQQGAKNNSCQPSACDTANVTYSATIKPIITNKCQGCHSGTAASGGIDLSGHAGLKAKVTDGRLWGAVNHLAGYSPMPKGGSKLSDCELGQIKKWIDAGATNN